MHKTQIINKVAAQTEWWVFERRKKLEELSHDSMSVNPFLLPFIFKFHNLKNFDDLANFLLGGHFLIGHGTGFGKLMDEKILPNVFGTKKLDASFRKNTPYALAAFDEIDHLIPRRNGEFDLLSLKSSRWTIQLTMAVHLNKAFCDLLKLRSAGKIHFGKIVVGVIYGTEAGLTDKYEILSGANRGKNHQVVDIKKHVDVRVGRNFWAWLNDGEMSTDQWVLAGIVEGIDRAHKTSVEAGHPSIEKLMQKYKREFVRRYERYISPAGQIDWARILNDYEG